MLSAIGNDASQDAVSLGWVSATHSVTWLRGKAKTGGAGSAELLGESGWFMSQISIVPRIHTCWLRPYAASREFRFTHSMLSRHPEPRAGARRGTFRLAGRGHPTCIHLIHPGQRVSSRLVISAAGEKQ